MTLPPLDILIYGHDGRGLGHASRSVGIGMALRRLYPEKKVACITGCKQTASLIGQAPLDWIKLPSYETKVIDGKSKGVHGNSNFSKKELGRYRAVTIRQLVETYRPRLVLVDHQPQGKQNELLPAIHASRDGQTHWVLGVRGVVGGVPQVNSEVSQKTFQSRYNALLWYGDEHILGASPKEVLSEHFGKRPQEMGYVSRMAEFVHWHPHFTNGDRPLGGIVSIPWIGEETATALEALSQAMTIIGDRYGWWRLFIGCKHQEEKRYMDRMFGHLPHCRVEPPSDLYPEALVQTRAAIIYGGYNSIIDILKMKKPALVFMRGMQDGEQEEHLQRLNDRADAGLQVISENRVTGDDLVRRIEELCIADKIQRKEINLDGAENTAHKLIELLG
jgi:predicted glycosyltransferase